MNQSPFRKFIQKDVSPIISFYCSRKCRLIRGVLVVPSDARSNGGIVNEMRQNKSRPVNLFLGTRETFRTGWLYVVAIHPTEMLWVSVYFNGYTAKEGWDTSSALTLEGRFHSGEV
jgi:hypothetical protein